MVPPRQYPTAPMTSYLAFKSFTACCQRDSKSVLYQQVGGSQTHPRGMESALALRVCRVPRTTMTGLPFLLGRAR